MGKLLFVSILATGHLNVCQQLAKLLIYKYPEHDVYFCVDEEFAKKIKDSCQLFKPVVMEKFDFLNPRKQADFIEKFKENFYRSGLKKYMTNLYSISQFQDLFILMQERIEKIIYEIKPDVILMDHLVDLPFVLNKKIPCGYITSANPLYCQNLDDYPPGLSGLSADREKDGHLWKEYKSHRKSHVVFENRRKWFDRCNLKPKNDDWLISGTDHLNLYVYPRYADYPGLIENVKPFGKWFRTSHCILDEQIENFLNMDENQNYLTIKYPGKELLTRNFLSKPGKLILFSMGTVVTCHLSVMNELLAIIGSLNHKFIVSMGPNHEEIELPDNCVGAPYLDQIELYEIVDSIIFHGGNNTFCELFFYHKKPFILIPFFGDQPDNGARLKDLNLGISIALNDLDEKSLNDAIERVTTDKEMKIKMIEASRLSKLDNGLEKFIDKLHLFLSKHKMNGF